MNKEQMNVHKALSELKILDARISNEIRAQQFVVANKHSNTKIGGETIANFAKNAEDQLKSIKTLINRRNAIKRAVTRSNASTMVSIGGKEYTVAEAIDMKTVGIEHIKVLCGTIDIQYQNARSQADKNNGDRLDSRADDYIKSLYQGADMKNMADEIKKVRDDFIAAQTMEIVDPIDALKEVQRLKNEIDAFMSEVDSALSTSNAVTVLEIEYETF